MNTEPAQPAQPAPIKNMQQFFAAVKSIAKSNDPLGEDGIAYASVSCEINYQGDAEFACYIEGIDRHAKGESPESAIESLMQKISTKKNDIVITGDISIGICNPFAGDSDSKNEDEKFIDSLLKPTDENGLSPEGHILRTDSD